ncbi:MAG: hypothetical protein K2G56_03385 [Eubacterium sp.]|nr:hypothetical protein [Eubacterium sp.]
MKKFIKVVNFCLPVVIYIACSLLAFLCWNVFNQGEAPVIGTNIVLVIIGSLLAGFLSRGKEGKKGMFVAIAAVVVATIIWIVAYTLDNSICAYIATALSSYLFNIHSCLSFEMQEYGLYIGYAVSLIVPIALILLGRLLRVKILRGKA